MLSGTRSYEITWDLTLFNDNLKKLKNELDFDFNETKSKIISLISKTDHYIRKIF